MKALRFGLASLVVVGLMLPAAAVSAAESSTAVCSGTWKVDFSPGITTAAQPSTFTTSPSAVTCTGQVRGHGVTGPGSFVEEGSLGGTVLMGEGEGAGSLTVPTATGQETVTFTYKLKYGPGYGLKYSDSLVGPYTFLFAPTHGDGIAAPVTQIAAVAWFTLKS